MLAKKKKDASSTHLAVAPQDQPQGIADSVSVDPTQMADLAQKMVNANQ